MDKDLRSKKLESVRKSAAERNAYLGSLSGALEDFGNPNNFNSQIRIHPYFGYTFNSAGPNSNSWGFSSNYDFELSESGFKLKGEERNGCLLLGLFGGSFAHAIGTRATMLEKLLEPTFPDKKIRVINFAVGGHAMPQAAQIFFYFRELIDIAVFIDGANEVVGFADNNEMGYPPDYVKFCHYQFRLSLQELTPKSTRLVQRLFELRTQSKVITKLSLLPAVRSLNGIHHLWQMWIARNEKAFNACRSEIMKELKPTEPFSKLSDSERQLWIVKRWQRHHLTINKLCVDSNISSFHFIQPNPYVAGSKSITSNERQALNSYSRIAPLIESGYPLLSSAFAEMQKQGIRGEDLTQIYTEVEDDIWLDGFHANARGIKIVVDKVADLINRQNIKPTATPAPKLSQQCLELMM